MELTQVLQSPVITEKSTMAQQNGKYTFLVNPSATKIDVKNAVEKIYGAKVDSVRMVPVLKKERKIGRGRTMTKRQQGKKAIVKVAEKQSIDFNKIK